MYDLFGNTNRNVTFCRTTYSAFQICDGFHTWDLTLQRISGKILIKLYNGTVRTSPHEILFWIAEMPKSNFWSATCQELENQVPSWKERRKKRRYTSSGSIEHQIRSLKIRWFGVWRRATHELLKRRQMGIGKKTLCNTAYMRWTEGKGNCVEHIQRSGLIACSNYEDFFYGNGWFKVLTKLHTFACWYFMYGECCSRRIGNILYGKK